MEDTDLLRIGAPPQGPAKPSRRWIIPVVVSVAVLVLAIAGVVITLALRQPEAPPAFDVTGTIVVRPHTPGKDCAGDSGYQDIKPGAQVAVTDSTGKTVGLGSLESGSVQVLSDTVSVCRFTFTIRNVPPGSGFYGVEVSHRGKVQFSESDLRAGNAKLQIGRFS